MKRILTLVDDVYEDLELWYPKLRLGEEGWRVTVAGPEAGRTYAGKHGSPCTADAAIAKVAAADFDARCRAASRPTGCAAIPRSSN